MKSFILNAETSKLPVQHLLDQVEGESVEILDTQGNIVAFILSPADHQARVYADANLDLDRHRNEVRQALEQPGGATTAQLLENAHSASLKHDTGQ